MSLLKHVVSWLVAASLLVMLVPVAIAHPQDRYHPHDCVRSHAHGDDDDDEDYDDEHHSHHHDCSRHHHHHSSVLRVIKRVVYHVEEVVDTVEDVVDIVDD